ncbi:lipoprotein [Klebsiella pneumoniae subsp. ozaenae]|uniref:Lipoprotein n=1 Tax=Klebsiella pneumoniae subsp. ozaenae TaxID=574 RepID=A0A377Z0B8_KLEPO|nr:lipoprotein [Klebsiella pneumoniae subsp. ozaenae]
MAASTSSALDMLLSELQFASDQRSRMDTLIRSYAAQDSKTGLNKPPVFDNQLATLLEDQEKVGAYGIVMMIRLPEFDLLRDNWGRAAAEEHYFTLINLLSTFIMRYPGALLARYHRSDFAVLLPHRTLKEADSIAGLLLKAMDALPPTRILDPRRYDAYRHLFFPQRAIGGAGDGTCGSGDAQRGAAGQQQLVGL